MSIGDRLARPVCTTIALLTLAACGTNPTDQRADKQAAPIPSAQSSQPAGGPTEEAVSPQPTTKLSPGPVALSVRQADLKGLKAGIVTANGWTAYRFEFDTPKPSRSVCMNDCFDVWPAITVNDASEITVQGVDRAIIGTLRRPDGYLQVTLNGWPLYRYKPDKTHDDAKGEGIGGGNWSTVGPDGKPVIKKGSIPKS
ncbi:hypothetical protein [Kribbella sp. NPDC055071]